MTRSDFIQFGAMIHGVGEQLTAGAIPMLIPRPARILNFT